MKLGKVIRQLRKVSIKVQSVKGGRFVRRRSFVFVTRFRDLFWDDTYMTKMEARNLIKWFLGRKYDKIKLPLSPQRRRQIRSRITLCKAVAKGIKDNLIALKLLDEYGLLDRRKRIGRPPKKKRRKK